MADLIAWLDLHASAVQGLTAIGIFVLTIVLAAATVWYAKSAKDQVDELVRARLALSRRTYTWSRPAPPTPTGINRWPGSDSASTSNLSTSGVAQRSTPSLA
jgi:hypothetical protein